jgi:hypothetical protein
LHHASQTAASGKQAEPTTQPKPVVVGKAS